MFEASLAIWKMAEAGENLTAFGDEVLDLYDTVQTESAFVIDQLSENAAVVNPTEQRFTLKVRNLAGSTVQVMLAHGESGTVPMTYRSSEAITGRSTDLLVSLCDLASTQAEAMALENIELPNRPTPHGLDAERLDEILCFHAERALLADRGIRDYFAEALNGDARAQVVADLYFERFRQLVGHWGSVRSAYSNVVAASRGAAADQEVEDLVDSWYEATAALREGLDGELRAFVLGEFDASLEQRSEFFADMSARCPDLAESLPTPAEDLERVEQIRARYELPPVVSVERLCVELDRLFAARSEFRSAITAADQDAAAVATRQIGRTVMALNDYRIELPAGFVRHWLTTFRDSEVALNLLFRHGEVIGVEAANDRRTELLLLESWATIECEMSPASIAATPILEVFDPPNPEAVADAQRAFCSAVDELFESRLAFREVVNQNVRGVIDDEAIEALATVIENNERLITLVAANMPLISPDGAIPALVNNDDVATGEIYVRQAVFGPYPVAVTYDGYAEVPAGASLAAEALKICPSPSRAVTVYVPPADAFDVAVLPNRYADDADPEQDYCAYLQAARHLELTFHTQLRKAAAGDDLAREDAAALSRVIGSYIGRSGWAAEALFGFPEFGAGIDATELFSPSYRLNYRFVNLMDKEEGSPTALQHVRTIVSTAPQFHPDVAAACPDLASEVLTLDYVGLDEVYSALADLE